MFDNRKILEHITKEMRLAPSEQIMMNGYVLAGHTILCAGVGTWAVVNRVLTRVTEQLRGAGLCLIVDDSDRYQELMADMSAYTEMLKEEGNNIEDFDRVIYIYTQNTALQQEPRLHLFSRILDPAGQLGV